MSLIQVAVDVIQGLLACSISTLVTTSFAAKPRRLRPAVLNPQASARPHPSMMRRCNEDGIFEARIYFHDFQ